MQAAIINIVIVALMGALVSAGIAGGSYLIGPKDPYGAKVSIYECGFDPFESAREPFAVKFFLVGVLFIIFDLELSYVFPWTISYNKLVSSGYWAMLVFLGLLSMGLLYE